MKLAEAYQRLQLVPPLEHERNVMEACESTLDLRRLGTSVRTLVELYLDLELALKSLGFANAHKAKFLMVCLSPGQAEYLRHELHHIHAFLDLDVDIAQVRFFPHEASENLVRQHRYYTWGVFCDHAVKELSGQERTFGPYGLVRSIKRDGDHYVALDRDHRRVCHLTKKGVFSLIAESTCPIHFRPSPSTAPTTFAAWSRPDLDTLVRMTRAYEL